MEEGAGFGVRGTGWGGRGGGGCRGGLGEEGEVDFFLCFGFFCLLMWVLFV